MELATAVSDGETSYRLGRRWRLAIRPIALSLDQVLLLVCMALLGVGVLMTQSANARVGLQAHDWIQAFFLNPEGVHAAIAILAMFVFWRLDYRRLLGPGLISSVTTYLVVAAVVLLALVLTHLGADINGARRWLVVRLGGHRISFQPSELAKWSLVMFMAAYAVHKAGVITDFFRGFLPLVAVMGFLCLLILKEDFGTTVLIGGVCMVMLLMAGCRWWHVALLVPVLAVVAYFAILSNPYRLERLMVFMHPHADPKGAGYNPIQSLLSFASGGIGGRGLGNGIQKMGYLPEDSTDFIFSLIAEELGFFGCMVVVLLYVTLTVAGWRIATRAEDLFGKMIAFGVTAMVSLQAAMNIAVVTVTVPTKGIALPLISSGGTGWILTCAAVGVMMSVERVSRLEGAGSSGAVPDWSGSQTPSSLPLRPVGSHSPSVAKGVA